MTVATSTVVPVRTEELVAWEQTRAELLEFVRRRVENLDAAEDIVQDVLERIHRTDLSRVTNLQGWLYQASRNAIVDHYRRRRQLVSLDDENASAEDPADGAEDGEPFVAVRELARCLRPLIEQLPEAYRSAVTRVDLDGHTHQAAAVASGVSVSGMKSRVQRGRRRLASMLQDCCAVETTGTGSIIDYSPRGDDCSCGPAE
jgi:RNA polymerase sigma-70 factor, ECF subfamily